MTTRQLVLLLIGMFLGQAFGPLLWVAFLDWLDRRRDRKFWRKQQAQQAKERAE